MSSNWRRQKPRNNYQRGSTQSSKPPLGNCKQSVPAWEKDFCAVIGSVPWWKVLETNRLMYFYERVVKWDSSAGEEAFKNAKARFWAERNGLACDLSLPDPDVYIDDVDWDAEVDPELMLDLERDGPEPPRTGEEDQVVILDYVILSGHDGWGTGWGDAEGINEEPKNSWKDEQWNDDSWGLKEEKPKNSWEDQQWNDDSWGIKEKPESWDCQNNTVFKTEPWDRKNGNNNNNGIKTESWDRKNGNNNYGFKTESWDRKNGNNNNGFKTESWNHKKSYNNSFNQKKVENWNSRDQGNESREWKKRGEGPRGGDRVEDCRWRNGRGRGRNRGGFQQHSNGWGFTETF